MSKDKAKNLFRPMILSIFYKAHFASCVESSIGNNLFLLPFCSSLYNKGWKPDNYITQTFLLPGSNYNLGSTNNIHLHQIWKAEGRQSSFFPWPWRQLTCRLWQMWVLAVLDIVFQCEWAALGLWGNYDISNDCL